MYKRGKPMEKYYGFSLPAELYDKLKKAAAAENRTVASVIRCACKSYVEKYN